MYTKFDKRMEDHTYAFELGSINNFADFKTIKYYIYPSEQSIIYCKCIDYQNSVSWKYVDDLILLNDCISGYSNAELK